MDISRSGSYNGQIGARSDKMKINFNIEIEF